MHLSSKNLYGADGLLSIGGGATTPSIHLTSSFLSSLMLSSTSAPLFSGFWAAGIRSI